MSHPAAVSTAHRAGTTDESHDLGSSGAPDVLPLTVEPGAGGTDLVRWIEANRDRLHADLARHGGVLFRGFALASEHDLSSVAEALRLQRMHYVEGATPRTQLNEFVYTSTEFPADHTIALHNELSYVAVWPMKILFLCLQPATTGGETPIADMRRVLARISPAVRDLFAQRGWMLTRNYGDGLGLPWQTAFRTSSRDEVERYCERHDIRCEWKDAGHLRTHQVRPAIASHPVTGESVWFNHIAFWHVSSLPEPIRETMLADYDERELPFNTFFGDGAHIDDEIVGEIRQAWDAETVARPWQAGDLLLLDNMLVSHGRRPFTGSRRVVVCMGDPSGAPVESR
jgi:alpha-ketoglutarate-dependent taurine dioxygenase